MLCKFQAVTSPFVLYMWNEIFDGLGKKLFLTKAGPAGLIALLNLSIIHWSLKKKYDIRMMSIEQKLCKETEKGKGMGTETETERHKDTWTSDYHCFGALRVWGWARGQDLATCAGLAHGRDYSSCIASEQTRQKGQIVKIPEKQWPKLKGFQNSPHRFQTALNYVQFNSFSRFFVTELKLFFKKSSYVRISTCSTPLKSGRLVNFAWTLLASVVLPKTKPTVCTLGSNFWSWRAGEW